MTIRVALATSLPKLPPSDRALAAALGRFGCEVRAAIWSDPGEAWTEFDAVVVRSCWDYHLRAEEFLGWIARLERGGVKTVNSPELIRWNADKVYLTELAGRGVKIPDTIMVAPGNGLDLDQVCVSRGWSSVVVKPRISASAYQTEKRSSGIARGPVLVQEFIPAVESVGEWSLIYFNHQFSHSVIKKPQALDFRVQKEYGGSAQAAPPPIAAVNLGNAVLQTLAQPSVFARVDLVADHECVWLMELELIEPELFLDLAPEAANRLASLIRKVIDKPSPLSLPIPGA